MKAQGILKSCIPFVFNFNITVGPPGRPMISPYFQVRKLATLILSVLLIPLFHVTQRIIDFYRFGPGRILGSSSLPITTTDSISSTYSKQTNRDESCMHKPTILKVCVDLTGPRRGNQLHLDPVDSVSEETAEFVSLLPPKNMSIRSASQADRDKCTEPVIFTSCEKWKQKRDILAHYL